MSVGLEAVSVGRRRAMTVTAMCPPTAAGWRRGHQSFDEKLEIVFYMALPDRTIMQPTDESLNEQLLHGYERDHPKRASFDCDTDGKVAIDIVAQHVDCEYKNEIANSPNHDRY